MLFEYIKKRISLLLLTQIFGWFLWWTVTSYFSYQYSSNLKSIGYTSLSTAYGFLISFLLFRLYRLFQKKSVSQIFILISAVAFSYGFAIIWRAWGTFLKWLLGFTSNPLIFQWTKYPKNAIETTFVFLAFSALYFVINFWQELQLQKEKTLKATALAQQAQLQMLRYQLNPHFLFNALNSIRAMVNVNQKKARQMITELSEFIRYSLVGGKMENVTIGKEIEAINNYLDIQKIRFGKRLEVNIDIRPDARDYKVPCFLIHPLVENAIKYGIQTSPVPLKVKISAAVKDGSLFIDVSNTGKLVDVSLEKASQDNGTGTGLNNVKQRLHHIFHDRHTFDIFEQDGWVHAKIGIKPEA